MGVLEEGGHVDEERKIDILRRAIDIRHAASQ